MFCEKERIHLPNVYARYKRFVYEITNVESVETFHKFSFGNRFLSNCDRTTACLTFYVTGLKVSKVQEGAYFACRKLVCSFRP